MAHLRSDISKHLIERDLVPAECSDIQVLMPADGVVQLRYTINLVGSDLILLGEALQAAGKEEEEMNR